MDERDERNEIIQSQLEELKRYKKIGPTPEQLMEIDLMYREKCKEVTRLTEHIHSLGDEIVRLRAAVDRKRWIPCSERLPEERENPSTLDYYEYPVTVSFHSVLTVRYYKFGNGHWWHGPQIMDKYVAAWMERPEPWEG